MSNDRPTDARDAPLRLFVYGTLKRGQCNHHLCRGARSIQPATLAGRLYYAPPGYPALTLDAERILARGTGDLEADLRRGAAAEDSVETESIVGPSLVHGELHVYADRPIERLRRFDRLEMFDPAAIERCEYVRVLTRVRAVGGGAMPAWTYIWAGDAGRLTPIVAGDWPGPPPTWRDWPAGRFGTAAR